MTHEFFPVDPCRIELVEDSELRFWTRAFGCNAEHLLDAIEAVGVSTVAVGEYLVMRGYLRTVRALDERTNAGSQTDCVGSDDTDRGSPHLEPGTRRTQVVAPGISAATSAFT